MSAAAAELGAPCLQRIPPAPHAGTGTRAAVLGGFSLGSLVGGQVLAGIVGVGAKPGANSMQTAAASMVSMAALRAPNPPELLVKGAACPRLSMQELR